MNNHTKDANAQISRAKGNKDAPVSMHENVPVWYDCCSCEAEPYWVEAFETAASDGPDRQSKDDQSRDQDQADSG